MSRISGEYYHNPELDRLNSDRFQEKNRSILLKWIPFSCGLLGLLARFERGKTFWSDRRVFSNHALRHSHVTHWLAAKPLISNEIVVISCRLYPPVMMFR